MLNKYYPPDFDPAKIPRIKRENKNNEMKVRMMLPMSVRCTNCGTYMYKGTKFNTKKEDVVGVKYLGIQIFRFYFRCSACGGEFTLKTDPKNSDYDVEHGATRNYEPWRAKDEAEAKAMEEEKDREADAMSALEHRTIDSKREMDILNALDEMKSLNARKEIVGVDAAVSTLREKEVQEISHERNRIDDELLKLTEDDEKVIKSMFQKKVKRLDSDGSDDDDSAAREQKIRRLSTNNSSSKPSAAQRANELTPLRPDTRKPNVKVLSRVSVKPKASTNGNKESQTEKKALNPVVALESLGSYNSDDSD